MGRALPACWLGGVFLVCLLGALGLVAVPADAGSAAGGVDAASGGPADADASVLTVESGELHTATAGSLSADWNGSDAGAASARSQSDNTIHLSQSLQLTPSQPGEYDAVHTYDIPNEVTAVSMTHRARAEVVATDGFEQTGPRSYSWDGSTVRPSLTLRVAANQTVAGTGPISAQGDYRFVDVGEWALVTRPQTVHGWEYRGPADFDVGFHRAMTVDGEGASGQAIVFMGPHQTYTRQAHGQTVRLVVPEAASLTADREAIFDSILSASNSLRVGDRDEEVFVVAAPTGTVEWGVRGVQTGDADAWVRDSDTLDEPSNVWLHEYVHTRQDYDVAGDARWLNEGTADYYAGRLTLEQGRIDFEEYRNYLARGARSRYEDAVLSDPTTWQNDPQYVVGALATGEVDRRTRLATDSGATFDRVFARLNEQEGPVEASDFYGHLRDIAGSDVANAGQRYTTTTDRPQPWNATQHGAAFGTTPARFVIGFEAPEPFSVGGPYRNGTFGEARPLVVVPGEAVAVNVAVRNTGGANGEYEATLRVDGATVARANGTLAPNETATHALSHELGSTGTYTLSVGDESVTVRVREPADPTVTAFSADGTEISPGGTVTLSMEVSNDADRPAEATIPVTLNGQQIDERSVRLDVDESETLTVVRDLDEPGEYTFGLGDASDRTVTVVVEEEEGLPTVLLIAGGLAVVGLIVVLVTVVLWWRGRRRQQPTGGHDPWG